MPSSNYSLNNFPPELLKIVFSHLPNRDIKNIRLTCAYFCQNSSLRFDRIFLSPNPRNIEVFETIARHETFRHSVVEIIYDDARLVLPRATRGDADDINHLIFPGVEKVPGWFSKAYEENLEHLEGYQGDDIERPDHLEVARKLEAEFGHEQSYRHYEELFRQQKGVINADADAQALAYGLVRFPNLRRITLTPATHGDPFFPLYETPMIRSMPYGMIYPIPRGWPMPHPSIQTYPSVRPWDTEQVKDQWRGFRLLTRVLAQHQVRSISEFVIDAKRLLTGLNCRLFDEPQCEEYKNFAAILQRPGFSQLDLALDVRGHWASFRNGRLHNLLALAGNLQRISISTDIHRDSVEPGQFVPLRTIFPIERWQELKHFGLSRFYVQQDDLFDLILALPSTLRSIELSFIYFVPSLGSYRSLLCQIRDESGWCKRPTSQRPTLTVHCYPNIYSKRTVVDLDQAVNEFLYCGGTNPFGVDSEDSDGDAVLEVGFHRNEFNPALDRPNVGQFGLMELGIVEKSQWCLAKMRKPMGGSE